ncbi:serine/threonine-protein kinase [Hyalangium gracile]|uniref:serine/threonine-protein kinase n=1 Tax=Hyalangium gracile TaxID=394092 RepID=UPI001CCE55DE|nr:serine/threonine-protein kinase [Hyalangium gracile]
MSQSPASACLDEVELLDLADGVPSPELRERAEAHLDSCAHCREQLAGFLRARAPAVEPGNTDPTMAATTVLRGDRSSETRMPELARGTLLGRYVVLDRLGAGGMGVVYAAYDPSIDRRIVLKLLLTSAGSVGSVERHMREAQAAARTQHPNVVAVHDVGTFEDRVFIAMELVDGGTLRQHLAATRPDWREVVRLYLEAGRGLAAAHAAGVIHRDFKPDNVLVDRAGRVRVTDFGLARMAAPALPPPAPADGPSSEPAQAPAEQGKVAQTAVAGTPGYIAPEVFKGTPADARSDQYSFCVSLYEGLFGSRPSQEGARAPVGRSSVPRAVQAIVTRGLAEAPEARHASMEALLEALDRAAFPRARRRVLVAAGVGLVVVAAAVVSLRKPAACADASPRLADVWSAARKEALLRAFTATGAPTAVSLHAATGRVLDAYAQAWVGAHRDACEATRVRGEQSEAALDLRMRCLDRRRRELGALTDVLLSADKAAVLRAPEAAQALSPLSACADVEALAQPVPPPERPELAPRVEVAFGKLADARARLNAAQWKQAAERAAAVAAEAESLGYKPLLGEALLVEGMAYKDLRDDKNATSRLRRAALASLAGRDDKHAIEALVHQIHVEGEIAQRPEQVEALTEQVNALLERTGGDTLLESLLLRYRGTALSRQGRYAEGLPLLQKALSLQEQLYGKDGVELHGVLNTLGDTLKGLERLDEALALQRRAQALLEAAYGPEHPRVALVLNNQGTTLVALKRYDEALASQEKALALLERAHGPGEPVGYVVPMLSNIGANHYSLEHYEEAERFLGRALELARKNLPPGHPTRVVLSSNVAQLLLDRGRPEEAMALLRESEAEQQAASAEGRRSMWFARTFAAQGEVLLRTGQFERAVEAARKSLELLRELGAESGRAGTLPILAQALLGTGRLPEAQRAAQEAIDLHSRLSGPGGKASPESLQVLGEVLLARGDAGGARKHLEEALASWEKSEATPLTMAAARFSLARALRQARTEPERARSLATAAREALAPTPEPRRAPLADIDAFLRARD